MQSPEVLVRETEVYLEDALNLTRDERDRIRRLQRATPPVIVDAHVHTSTADHFARELAQSTRGHMMSTFAHWPLELSELVHSRLFDEKEWRSIRFPHVYTELDRRRANSYLLDVVRQPDGIVACGLVGDTEYTRDILMMSRVLGLKMYYHDSNTSRPRIMDYFVPDLLRECEVLGKPIILHLPRWPLSLEAAEVVEVARQFPDLRIILAHCGLQHIFSDDYIDALHQLKTCGNVFMDTARVQDTRVIRAALSVLGSRRLLFGSDEPLSLLRSVAYVHPELGKRIVTDFQYHWLDPAEHAKYRHLAIGAPLSVIAQMEAIVEAVRSTDGSWTQAMDRVFFENAAEIFSIGLR